MANGCSYNAETGIVQFPLNNETGVVCPYCNSGFIIITFGIEGGIVKRMSICSEKKATIPLYCTYCGKDTTEPYRLEVHQ